MCAMLIKLDKVESTNTYIKSLILEDNIKELPFAVYSTVQDVGKGQRGNTWYTGKYTNLALSLCVEPNIKPKYQFLLNITLSLGVLDFLREQFPSVSEPFYIKWPNDIYAGNRKLGGILLENIIMGSAYKKAIFGIGLNINEDNFPNNLPNPISLKNISDKLHQKDTLFDIDLIAQELYNSILKRHNNFLIYAEPIDNCFNSLKSEYFKNLLFYNQKREFIYKSERILAQIKDIDIYGKLILICEDAKQICCDIKELEYVL